MVEVPTFSTSVISLTHPSGFILLMVEEIQRENQLRLVVEIPLITGFYTSQVVVWDFFHQQLESLNPPLNKGDIASMWDNKIEHNWYRQTMVPTQFGGSNNQFYPSLSTSLRIYKTFISKGDAWKMEGDLYLKIGDKKFVYDVLLQGLCAIS